MAIVHINSFDHQVPPTNAGGGGATTGLVNRKLWDTVAPTPATVDTVVFQHGTASLKFAAAAAGASYVRHIMNLPTAGFGGWYRAATGTPSSTTVYAQAAGAVSTVDIRRSSDGVVYLTGGAIDGTEVALHTPVAGNWYWYTLFSDMTSNPNLSSARVYSAALGLIGAASRNPALAADTIATMAVGPQAVGHGFDLNVDSYVITDTAAFVPPQKVQLLTPTDGTHSFTAGDFQDQASVNITTAAAGLVDDYPPSLADFVKQVVIRSTGYVEFQFTDLVTTGLDAANFVQLGIANHPVGAATANTSIMRLLDGATQTAEAIVDMTFAADTLEYHKTGYQTAPSTSGAWTNVLVNGLRARWGFSDDVTPPPALDSIWLEVSSPMTLPVSGSGKKARARVSNRIGIPIS